MKSTSFDSVERYDKQYQSAYYFESMTKGPPYIISVVFMAAILLIILALFSLEVIEATQKIGVRKTLDHSTKHSFSFTVSHSFGCLACVCYLYSR
jgi:hypothetical protein